jgi:hypothetical protein
LTHFWSDTIEAAVHRTSDAYYPLFAGLGAAPRVHFGNRDEVALIPTGTHGLTCFFYANLKPFSRR